MSLEGSSLAALNSPLNAADSLAYLTPLSPFMYNASGLIFSSRTISSRRSPHKVILFYVQQLLRRSQRQYRGGKGRGPAAQPVVPGPAAPAHRYITHPI